MKHNSTVLIVDDELVGHATLEALLTGQGYNLAFASNGPGALEKAVELIPDLILLDVMMPDMDGFEVCRRLRADPLLAEVPVIMVTALADRSSRLQGIEAGADDFVSKPFDRVELRARVQTITRLNRYRRLLQERAQFEWVVEQADDGYLIVNDSDEILYANPKAWLYLGLPSPGTFLELVRKQYRCEPQAAWADWPERSAPVAQSPRYLVRPESPNANAFWLQVDLVEIVSRPSGRHLVRLCDVTTDIIEQRLMWTFHKQVTHKLRTPITHLTGFLQVLSEGQPILSDTKKLLLSAACQGALRLQDEIEDILTYIGASDMVEPGHEQCNLTKVSSLIDEIIFNLELKSTRVSYEGLENLDDTYMPISQRAIEMILWELLGNAKKFHPEKSPTVEVKISNVSRSQIASAGLQIRREQKCDLSNVPGGVRIQIGDDGLTLSPDQLAKMWIPYYQAEKSFTGEIPGIGLGLPMVATLLWDVGGTCRAYNREEGPGIVVELVLPLVQNNE